MWAILLTVAEALAQPPIATDCELHLAGMKVGGVPSTTAKLLVRSLPGSDDPLAFINVMSPRDRMATLSDAQYRTALNLPPASPVIRHWDIQVNPAVRKSRLPLFPTPGRCHSELTAYSVSGFAPDRSGTGRNEVRVKLLLRDFGADGVLIAQLDESSDFSVETEKKVGRGAAMQSLQVGAETMIDHFGENVTKARKKASSRKDIR